MILGKEDHLEQSFYETKSFEGVKCVIWGNRSLTDLFNW